MIVIDIPMPQNCNDCPCSYQIRSGEYEGYVMCNALEFKDVSDGFRKELNKYFVVEQARHRPESCPIVMTLYRHGKKTLLMERRKDRWP